MKIGIIGESGSGIDTLATELEENYGFQHVSLTDILGHGTSRNQQSEYADTIRRPRGDSYLVNQALRDAPEDVVLSGICVRAELERIHTIGGVIVGVLATPKIRYGNIKRQNEAQGQTTSSYEEFLEQSAREDAEGADEGRVSVKDADYFVANSGTREQFLVATRSLVNIQLNLRH